MRHSGRAAISIALLLMCAGPGRAAEDRDGKELLESNCGRCHAVSAGETSRLKEAPNLWIVLRSYPRERLDFELAEGIGSKHRDMPQIQFDPKQIDSIEAYLFGEEKED